MSRARPRPGEAWIAWEARLRSRWRGVLFAKSRLRGADLDDAVSETMCRTFGKHVDEPFPSEDDAFRYGSTVALNGAANAARHRERHPTVPYHELLDTALGTQASPSELVEDSVRLTAVLEAVAALAPRRRALITAKYVDGLSTREAAQRLDMTENAFGVAHYRAMRELHRNLRKRGLLSVAAIAGPASQGWFGRMLRGARPTRAGALSTLGMTAVLILGSPAIVVHPEGRFTEATDRVEGLDIVRPDGRLREPPRGGASAAQRWRTPTPPRVEPRRAETRRLPEVEASVCVNKVCGGVGPSLPPAGPGDTPYVRVPGVAGEEDRYIYARLVPGPVCSVVPTTPATGCVEAEASPSPSPEP